MLFVQHRNLYHALIYFPDSFFHPIQIPQINLGDRYTYVNTYFYLYRYFFLLKRIMTIFFVSHVEIQTFSGFRITDRDWRRRGNLSANAQNKYKSPIRFQSLIKHFRPVFAEPILWAGISRLVVYFSLSFSHSITWSIFLSGGKTG